MKLWHCENARSLRVLWALEEMGLDYELEVLPFPPRVMKRSYLEINPLGTVPYFVDGETHMTESTAILQYLVQRHDRPKFGLPPDHPEYGAFLNWLFMSDATLTFPQALILRYGTFESEDRKQPQVVEDYSRWYLGRLKLANARLADHSFLCADEFTIADIAVGYALFLGETLGLAERYESQTRAYLDRLKARDGFQCVLRIQADTPVTQG